jgi:transcriptional regulator with XRE-family HTH domain
MPTPYRLNARLITRITKNVRRLLAERGWTAEKLAFYSDVAKSNLSSTLNGKVNWTLQTLDKLASKGFKCDINEFFQR